VEVLPRLCQIKYASGTIEELLYVDMPREYHNGSGQIVLDYAKAIQESVFEQLRVVREGQLRIVFNTDLKVYLSTFSISSKQKLFFTFISNLLILINILTSALSFCLL
jgi:LIM-domain binding protein